jgi:hypothetical protein
VPPQVLPTTQLDLSTCTHSECRHKLTQSDVTQMSCKPMPHLHKWIALMKLYTSSMLSVCSLPRFLNGNSHTCHAITYYSVLQDTVASFSLQVQM